MSSFSVVNPNSQLPPSNTLNNREIKIDQMELYLIFSSILLRFPHGKWFIYIFSFGIGRRHMGSCGHPNHRFCRKLCVCLCLRERMRGRAISSPLALTSTSLTLASFTVLNLPPYPLNVLSEAGYVVIVIVSLTNMRLPPPEEKDRIIDDLPW